ncbi:ras guanine nucleotide exchange factor domain-containing protein [Polychytrium aggregatum]|uniref:ras guanine nucleotide exchange factor domain-containing protein n=1 Tax=Polychytrium aggregatum TaxID=110093 RepID=UPI0022FE88B4|nr:ras guanine nucleotide exchange factor domain-containing protein [Polychytrium aggregatum]KAI9208978.1 ras guanine nucleotide exchange factor domain-containing protein [Polychytrium aggregatum]
MQPSMTPLAYRKYICEFDITQINPTHIAAQLTLVDWRFFSAVTPDAVASHLWPSRTANAEARQESLLALIRRCNTISYWVCTVVCSYEHAKKRAEVIDLFVRVAKHCKELSNFYSAMAIFSGLSNQAVARLKKTQELLSKKARRDLELLGKDFSYEHNHKVTRALENAAINEKKPMIPLIMLIMKDLTALRERNDAIGTNEQINIGKLRSLYRRLSVIEDLKDRPYTTLEVSNIPVAGTRISLYDYCHVLPSLSGPDIDRLSHAVEPPNHRIGCSEVPLARKDSIGSASIVIPIGSPDDARIRPAPSIDKLSTNWDAASISISLADAQPPRSHFLNHAGGIEGRLISRMRKKQSISTINSALVDLIEDMESHEDPRHITGSEPSTLASPVPPPRLHPSPQPPNPPHRGLSPPSSFGHGC